MEPSRSKPGRRPRGVRHAITVRIPLEQWEVLEQIRSDEGFAHASDYIVAVLAERHGLPIPSYVNRGGMEPLPKAG